MSADELQRLARRIAGGDAEAAKRALEILDRAGGARFTVRLRHRIRALVPGEESTYREVEEPSAVLERGPFRAVKFVSRRMGELSGIVATVECQLEGMGWTVVAILDQTSGGWESWGAGEGIYSVIEVV